MRSMNCSATGSEYTERERLREKNHRADTEIGTLQEIETLGLRKISELLQHN